MKAARCLCENMHYIDHPSALPECVDLPPRLVRSIVASMHQLEIANVTPLQLDVWSHKLHSVSSRIKAEEPCRNCGRLYTVTLHDLIPHRNLASRIRCSHMNQPCTSPSVAGSTSTFTDPSPTSTAPRQTSAPAPRLPEPPSEAGTIYPRTRPARSAYSTFVGLGDQPCPPLYLSGQPLQSPSLESDLLRALSQTRGFKWGLRTSLGQSALPLQQPPIRELS